QTLATIGDDRIAKLWDVATGKERQTLRGQEGAWIVKMAFAPDGRTLARGEAHPFEPRRGGFVKLLDLATGNERGFPVPGGAWPVAFAPDSMKLVSGSNRGTVTLRDVARGGVEHTFYGGDDRVHFVAFSRDGKMLASGGNDMTVRVWNVVTGRMPVTLFDHGGAVSCLAISPDGKSLATGDAGGIVKLRDTVTGQERLCLAKHDGCIK